VLCPQARVAGVIVFIIKNYPKIQKTKIRIKNQNKDTPALGNINIGS